MIEGRQQGLKAIGGKLARPRKTKAFARLRRKVGLVAVAASPVLLGGCDGALSHGFLNPAGPVASGERHLFVVVCCVLVFVVAPVLILTPLIAWHYRLSNKNDAYRPKWAFNWPLEGFIWIPPTLIVIGLAVILWTDTHKLDPYTRLKGALPPVRVQAVALDWKWLFIYPDAHIATVNELDVPAGRPVHLDLTSGTVMQSLLLPRLAGQIYAMAGMSTQLNFAADRPGVYPGEDTQYNGKGFQNEKFDVVARSPADYARWVESVRANGQPLDAAAYQAISARSVQARPLVFSTPPPGLYAHIVSQSGGASHPHPQDGP